MNLLSLSPISFTSSAITFKIYKSPATGSAAEALSFLNQTQKMVETDTNTTPNYVTLVLLGNTTCGLGVMNLMWRLVAVNSFSMKVYITIKFKLFFGGVVG